MLLGGLVASTDGLYIVASAYHWLGIESRGGSTVNSSSWLWRVKIPAKIQWITWLVTKDALPIVNMFRSDYRGLSHLQRLFSGFGDGGIMLVLMSQVGTSLW
ncbi:hypothetical protein RIF29_20404 [Crotalaria pallida]|uniref:Uncharacterized protein n=1 Tax=Crotalaria pallida TaxID=3830 RepID=A0AAN9F2H0_CROPI